MSTNMGDISTAEPDGSTKQVKDLDDHQRDHRNANKVTWDVEHSVASVNKAGKHEFPIVTNAQEAALTDNPTGRMVINTTKSMLRYFDGADWQDVVGVEFPSGTRLVFDQDAAPTGWTRDTSYNDKVIRIVSAGRSDGGSWTINGLTSGNESAHTHDIATNGSSSMTLLGSYIMKTGGLLRPASVTPNIVYNFAADYTDGGSAHNHTISAGSSWRPLHRDMIVAEKD